MAAFGQATDAFVGTTKSNVKTALTRAPIDQKIVDGMTQALKVGKMDFPKPPPPPKGAFMTPSGEKYAFGQVEWTQTPSRKDFVKGVNVGIIYVEANSKDLPNGYYTGNVKQVGTDATGKPEYGFTLTNTNGIQALSIGRKTNGAAGNTNGTKGLRGTKSGVGGTVKGGQVTGGTPGTSAGYETILNQLETFAPKFTNSGGKEILSTDGLDTQIVEAVAAFVSSTKSNTKTA